MNKKTLLEELLILNEKISNKSNIDNFNNHYKKYDENFRDDDDENSRDDIDDEKNNNDKLIAYSLLGGLLTASIGVPSLAAYLGYKYLKNSFNDPKILNFLSTFTKLNDEKNSYNIVLPAIKDKQQVITIQNPILYK